MFKEGGNLNCGAIQIQIGCALPHPGICLLKKSVVVREQVKIYGITVLQIKSAKRSAAG
jgi:hypothetical protein